MLLILVIFIALFVILELPELLKSKAYQDIMIVTLLLFLSTAYGIAYHLHSEMLPNPNQILYSFDPLAESFQSLLQVGDEIQP